MAKLIMEQATFMVLDLDSECSGRFKIHVNGQGDVTIKCIQTQQGFDIEFDELKLIYDAVTSVYSEEGS